MIELIALILEDGNIAEDSEAVGKATWNKELPVIILCQFHSHMLAVGRAAFADVNGYVKDGTLDAADEFALGEGWTLEMKTSHYAIGAFAFVVLNKTDGSDLFVKLPLGEGFEEIATGVCEDARLDDDYAVNGGFYYVHMIQL